METEGIKPDFGWNRNNRPGGTGKQSRRLRKMTTKTTITLPFDQLVVAEYTAWLQTQGYDVRQGTDSSTWINGVDTNCDEDLDALSQQLWGKYCRS